MWSISTENPRTQQTRQKELTDILYSKLHVIAQTMHGGVYNGNHTHKILQNISLLIDLIEDKKHDKPL